MTFRKRRRPAPRFGIPPPYNPIDGTHATLHEQQGTFPYCAMMQVAAEDEYDDYVVCRGFDTRMLKFVDYEEGNSAKPGISVAKPFDSRSAGTYDIGQVFPAFLPIQGTEQYTPPSPTAVPWRVGQNPGASTDLHPDDLDDPIVAIQDYNGKYVNWMLIEGGGAPIKWAKLNGTLSAGAGEKVSATEYKLDEADSWEAGKQIDDVYAPPLLAENDTISSGEWVLIAKMGGKWFVIATTCE